MNTTTIPIDQTPNPSQLYTKSQCVKWIRQAVGPTARVQNMPGASVLCVRKNGREVKLFSVAGIPETERANKLLDLVFESQGSTVQRFKDRIEVVPKVAPVEPPKPVEQPKPTPKKTFGDAFRGWIERKFGKTI